jgi:hypothetical protein
MHYRIKVNPGMHSPNWYGKIEEKQGKKTNIKNTM